MGITPSKLGKQAHVSVHCFLYFAMWLLYLTIKTVRTQSNKMVAILFLFQSIQAYLTCYFSLSAIYILWHSLEIELGESSQQCPVCPLMEENKTSGVYRVEYRAQEICKEALSSPQLNTGHCGYIKKLQESGWLVGLVVNALPHEPDDMNSITRAHTQVKGKK